MKKRMYNMDLCRIMAMLGILTLHFNLSGVLLTTEPGSSAYWMSQFLEIVAFCSVNVFAMLSGYLGWMKHEQKSKRLVELLFTVFFWCVVITSLFLIIRPGDIENGKRDIIGGLCPPLIGRYWYITCFIPLSLFQPYINKLLMGLSEKQERNLIAVSVILLGWIPSIFMIDFFYVNKGFSFLWLAVCYSIGHYLRRIEKKVKRSQGVWLFLGGMLLQIGVKVFTYFCLHVDSYYFLLYIAPFIVMESIGAFIIFMRIKIENKYAQKIVAFLAAYVFDVYIMHCHPFIFDKIISGMFNEAVKPGMLAVLKYWLIFCISAYLIFALCGFIRVKLFRILKVDFISGKISKMIDENL